MSRDEHDDCLLLYCTAGHGWLEAEGARDTIRPGTLVVLPPGVAHRYAADERDPWTLWWVHFAGEATSAWPGWVQGALVSARRAAAEILLRSPAGTP